MSETKWSKKIPQKDREMIEEIGKMFGAKVKRAETVDEVIKRVEKRKAVGKR